MRIAIVQSQAALSGVQQNLREGDFVFVKTLKNLGGGKYTVSFAGGRFDVMSERALREGQSFRAQVSFAGGKVLLAPVQTGAQGAAAFLQSQGLEADGLAQRIMQFLAQSGSRLDPALMQKVRRASQKFRGRETEAAESALVLEEKGIDSESAALEKLMDLLDGDGSGSQGRDDLQGQNGGADFGQDKNLGQGQEGARNGDAAQNQNEAQGQESAALDGADFLRSLNDKKGWAFFPYEFLGSGGVIRARLDREKNAVEKMIVNYKSSGANIYFSVYFNDKKEPRAVKVWASQEAMQEKLRSELPALKAAFGADVKVEAVSARSASAFGVEDLPLLGVEAFA